MAGAQLSWDQLDKRKVYTILPFASLTLRSAMYPASVVKTRMQAGMIQSQSVSSALRGIRQAQGIRGLYRGFSFSLCTTPVSAVYFTVLEKTRSSLAGHAGHGNAVAGVAAGAVSSAVGQTISVPCDVITNRLQVSDPPRNAVHVARELVRSGGPRALWRGYSMSLAVMVPSSSITWGTFYTVQGQLFRLLCAAPAEDPHCEGTWARDVVVSGISGCAAGITTGVLLNPVDVVRTRMQVLDPKRAAPAAAAAAGSSEAPAAGSGTGRPTIAGTVRTLVAEQGLRGFASGWRARVTMLAPLMTCIMSGYEVVKRVCKKSDG